MKRLSQWALFAASILLMGLWFPLSLIRRDERWFWADNFGLDSKRYIPGEDSVAKAWDALRDASPSKIPHQLKNISHEWAKESPKRAVKFLSFVILLLVIGIIA